MKIVRQVINFYVEGFRNMSSSNRRLWAIILIKLFIMFVILKVFFFPDILQTNFNSDNERSEHVIEQLTNN
jgi:hypothetical protein